MSINYINGGSEEKYGAAVNPGEKPPGGTLNTYFKQDKVVNQSTEFTTRGWGEQLLPASTGDYLYASGADGQLVLAAVPSRQHVLYGFSFGYTGTPGSGYVSIKDGDNLVWKEPVTASGPGSFEFPNGKVGSVNTAMTIEIGSDSSPAELSISSRGLR